MMNQWEKGSKEKKSAALSLKFHISHCVLCDPLVSWRGQMCMCGQCKNRGTEKNGKLPFGIYSVSPGSSTKLKHYRDALKTCMRTTQHCSFTLHSTLSEDQEVFMDFITKTDNCLQQPQNRSIVIQHGSFFLVLFLQLECMKQIFKTACRVLRGLLHNGCAVPCIGRGSHLRGDTPGENVVWSILRFWAILHP